MTGVLATGCSAVMFGASSVIMNVVNKALTRRFHHLLNQVVCIQMLVTAALQLPWVRFAHGWWTWARIVPPLFALMLLTSIYAIDRISVGSFVVLRNTAPTISYGIELLTGVEQPSAAGFLPMLGLIAGSIVYEWGNVQFDTIGLLIGVANMVIGAFERTAQKSLMSGSSVRCSKPTLSFLNNFVALGLVVPILNR